MHIPLLSLLPLLLTTTTFAAPAPGGPVTRQSISSATITSFSGSPDTSITCTTPILNSTQLILGNTCISLASTSLITSVSIVNVDPIGIPPPQPTAGAPIPGGGGSSSGGVAGSCVFTAWEDEACSSEDSQETTVFWAIQGGRLADQGEVTCVGEGGMTGGIGSVMLVCS